MTFSQKTLESLSSLSVAPSSAWNLRVYSSNSGSLDPARRSARPSRRLHDPGAHSCPCRLSSSPCAASCAPNSAQKRGARRTAGQRAPLDGLDEALHRVLCAAGTKSGGKQVRACGGVCPGAVSAWPLICTRRRRNLYTTQGGAVNSKTANVSIANRYKGARSQHCERSRAIWGVYRAQLQIIHCHESMSECVWSRQERTCHLQQNRQLSAMRVRGSAPS